MSVPNKEGFFWYKHPECYSTIIQTEYRPDNGDLYAFCIGFSGGTLVRIMTGEWLGEATKGFKR